MPKVGVLVDTGERGRYIVKHVPGRHCRRVEIVGIARFEVIAARPPGVFEAQDSTGIPYFEILKDKLDIEKVPFTERGSRILVGLRRDPDPRLVALSAPPATSSPTMADGSALSGSLEVRMAERWTSLEWKLGNHRVRRPLIGDIRPTDRGGNSLAFKLHTWPHRLLLQTSVGDFEVFFADRETLYICLPNARCGLTFTVMAESFLPDELGGVFDGPRRVAMTSSSSSTSLHAIGEASGHLVAAFDSPGDGRSALAVHIPESAGRPRIVDRPDVALRRVQESWTSWFDATPRVSQQFWREYYFAWTVLRNGLLSPTGYLKREALAPSKTHYLGIWHWDAYFHALGYRHVDAKLAQDQLWAMLDHQIDDGMIPDVVHDEGLIVREDGPNGRKLTKPPLMAWAALRLFESGSGSGFLKEIYEPLARWNNWWFDHCDDDEDGIVQYDHPYSSGLDDSPLWDQGMPVESPDLNTYLCVHMQSLARIARVIGRYDDAEEWDAKARKLSKLIASHFWDSSSGVFWAKKDHDPIKVLTPFNLLPIWTGRLSNQQVRAAVSRLTSPSTFWTEFGIPTVSRGDSQYDPDRMWRGPVWINVNYMWVAALWRAGYCGLSDLLADRTIDLVLRRGVGEYYNSVTGEIPAKAAPAFGWSAALFVDLLIRRTRRQQQSPRFRTYADGSASF